MTREQVLRHLRENVGAEKRDLARAFGLKGSERIALKSILRDLAREGLFDVPARGTPAPADPGLMPVKIFAVDVDEGEALARPIEWAGPGKPPLIRLRGGQGRRAPGEGERVLVRIRHRDGRRWEAEIVRGLATGAATERVVGVVRRGQGGLVLEPADRRLKLEFALQPGTLPVPAPGELVAAEVASTQRLERPRARVVEHLGPAGAARAASLIAIAQRGIPVTFAPEALAEAARARPPGLDGREDLRALPLVTIDGEDARDFDDAVFAEPDADPKNPGGYRLLVAIADVSFYVRPGAPLDREARKRGNSVYFPDRVVPMLPERLSNDLCSLRPHEDRPVLAAEIWVDSGGRKLRHRVLRAMMRSAARLTYEQAQAHADGRGGLPPDLDPGVVDRLFAAYRALHDARRARGTLDLDLEERKVELGSDGRVARIVPRPRFDAHRLIEEFMILANVCAAESLERARAPCLYRVHDKPSPERLEALRVTLETVGYRLARGQPVRASTLARVLDWAADKPFRHMLNETVLRTQALAVYSPGNLGHFGLALPRYAHFTSPIRRYADLVVHRSLVSVLGLGPGGLEPGADLAAIGEHVSETERRAAAAERDAMSRYVAGFLADRVGASFPGRVSGVEQFGLFVTLDGLGADGLVPMTRIPGGPWRFDPAGRRLVDRRGDGFALGDPVEVELLEANQVTGGLLFAVGGPPKRRPGAPPARPAATRGGPRRPGRR